MTPLRSGIFAAIIAVTCFTGPQALAQGVGAVGNFAVGANTCVGRVNLVYRDWPEFAPFSCSTRAAPGSNCTCTLKSEFDGSTVIGSGVSEGPKAAAGPTPFKVSTPPPLPTPPKCRIVRGQRTC